MNANSSISAPPEPGDLVLDDIAIRRGEHILLAGLNITLQQGHAIVIKGGNGTGKSTLLRTVAGFISPHHGRMSLNGRDFKPHHPDCPLIISSYRGADGLSEEMDGNTQLRLYQQMRGRHPHLGDAADYDRFFCAPFLGKEVRHLSTGQRQRIALTRLCLDLGALAQHHQAGQNLCWLLDEPDSGLDEEGRFVLEELISDMLGAGGRVMMVSHQPRTLRFPHQTLRLQHQTEQG